MQRWNDSESVAEHAVEYAVEHAVEYAAVKQPPFVSSCEPNFTPTADRQAAMESVGRDARGEFLYGLRFVLLRAR